VETLAHKPSLTCGRFHIVLSQTTIC